MTGDEGAKAGVLRLTPEMRAPGTGPAEPGFARPLAPAEDEEPTLVLTRRVEPDAPGADSPDVDKADVDKAEESDPRMRDIRQAFAGGAPGPVSSAPASATPGPASSGAMPESASAGAASEVSGAPDPDALREMIRQVIREELSGELGERISHNIRLLIARELRAALDEREG